MAYLLGNIAIALDVQFLIIRMSLLGLRVNVAAAPRSAPLRSGGCDSLYVRSSFPRMTMLCQRIF